MRLLTKMIGSICFLVLGASYADAEYINRPSTCKISGARYFLCRNQETDRGVYYFSMNSENFSFRYMISLFHKGHAIRIIGNGPWRNISKVEYSRRELKVYFKDADKHPFVLGFSELGQESPEDIYRFFHLRPENADIIDIHGNILERGK